MPSPIENTVTKFALFATLFQEQNAHEPATLRLLVALGLAAVGISQYKRNYVTATD